MQLKTLFYICYAPDRREGAISVAFVRPSVRLSVRLSVCPSVAHIANNFRTQRPSVYLNLEGRFPTLHAIRIPVSRSNGQRSGLEAVGGTLLVANDYTDFVMVLKPAR